MALIILLLQRYPDGTRVHASTGRSLKMQYDALLLAYLFMPSWSYS